MGKTKRKPKFAPKICEKCENKFAPTSGLQEVCDTCKKKLKPFKERSRDEQSIIPEGASRGESLRGSPLALDIERSVQRRVAKMR